MAELNGTRIFSVDKFLGLNEAADGETELKIGEASKIENFYITDEMNLKIRSGVSPLITAEEGEKIVFAKTGKSEFGDWILYVVRTNSMVWVHAKYENEPSSSVNHGLVVPSTLEITFVNVFPFADSLYVLVGTRSGDGGIGSAVMKCSFKNSAPKVEAVNYKELYAPLMMDTTSPDGKGEAREAANLLTDLFRVQYSADGTSSVYKLPLSTNYVEEVKIDNEKVVGTFNAEEKTYTFDTAPAKGVNNVEFLCGMVIDDDIRNAKEKFLNMRHSELYNGATDARVFFYGDGSNVCYYTGIPAYGSGLYLPLGNEIAVDFSASPITAMTRNYSSLIGFQPDGAFVINYEQITLADGNLTAGFTMRTASREIGNQMDGQVQTVNNYLRTLCNGNLYEWKYTSSQYKDERYAKCISQKVSRTLSKADPSKVITCDDNNTHTYYMFLNDKEGTVLVNRYDLEVWTIYKGDVFKDVISASAYGGDVIFFNEKTIYKFDKSMQYDTDTSGNNKQIKAVWESGYMSFGAPHRKKYSSTLWVSMLPEHFADLKVTVKTDKRNDYITKEIGYLLANFTNVDFSNFSFLTWAAPKIKRVQLKVKKFIYYKLIFRVEKAGAKATVLGYDQQVRYSSNVK